MWPHCIVMTTPGLNDYPCIGAVSEPFKAQTFIPELAVKALPCAILPWLAGVDVRGVDAFPSKPLQDRLGDELRAVCQRQDKTDPFQSEFGKIKLTPLAVG